MKRLWAAVAVVLVGLSVTGVAQQKKNAFKAKAAPIKVKPAPEDKAEKRSSHAGVPKATKGAGASSANARDLKTLEHQTAKGSSSPKHRGVKKTSAVKLQKDKNTPINFGEKGSKNAGASGRAAANPYKGRLKQKGHHKN